MRELADAEVRVKRRAGAPAMRGHPRIDNGLIMDGVCSYCKALHIPGSHRNQNCQWYQPRLGELELYCPECQMRPEVEGWLRLAEQR